MFWQRTRNPVKASASPISRGREARLNSAIGRAGGLYQGCLGGGKYYAINRLRITCSGNGETFATSTFIGGVGVIELKRPVQTRGDKINF